MVRKLLFVFIFFLTLLATIALFLFQPFSLFALKQYGTSHLGADLTYSSYEKGKDKSWILHDVEIYFSSPFDQPAAFSAKEARISFAFSGWRPKLSLFISFDFPILHLDKIALRKKTSSSLAFLPFSFFDLQVHVNTENGDAVLGAAVLPFILKGSFGSKNDAYLQVGNSFFATLKEDVEIAFDQFSLEAAPIPMNGIVNGNLSITKKQKHRYAIDADIQLSDLIYRQKEASLVVKEMNVALAGTFHAKTWAHNVDATIEAVQGEAFTGKSSLAIELATMTLVQSEHAAFSLNGRGQYENDSFSLTASATRDDEEIEALFYTETSELTCHLFESYFCCSAKEMSSQQLNWLQGFAKSFFPSFPELFFEEGSFCFSGNKILGSKEVTLEKIKADRFAIQYPDLGLRFQGMGICYDTTPSIGSLKLVQGRLEKKGIPLIKELQASAGWNREGVQTGTIEGILFGFRGKGAFDAHPDGKLAFTFDGAPDIENPVFSLPKVEKLPVLLAEHTLHANGNLTHTAEGFSLESDFFIENHKDEKTELITCRVDNFTIHPFSIGSGWFHVDSLSLPKYLQALFDKPLPFHIGGTVTGEGRFTPKIVQLQYRTDHLTLENEGFMMTIEKVGALDQNDETLLPGEHTIHLDTWDHFGEIPIAIAYFYDKSHDLLFADIQGVLQTENQHLFFPEIDALCEGLYIAGSMKVNIHDPVQRDVEMSMKAHTLHGNTMDLNQFLSKIHDLPILRSVPMEAELAFDHKGAAFFFHFHQDQYDFLADVSGRVMNGVCKFSKAPLKLENLHAGFSYSTAENTISFTEVVSDLHVGNFPFTQTFQFSCDELLFSHNENEAIRFDGWIGDRKKDLVRLKGRFLRQTNGSLALKLNRAISHFGNIPLSVCELLLSENGEPLTFSFALDCSLPQFLPEVQKLARTRFIPLPESLQKRLQQMGPSEGILTASMLYTSEDERASFRASGVDLKVDDYSVADCSFSANWEDGSLCIEELRADDISLSCTFTPREEDVRINFIGLSYRDALVLGADGMIRKEDLLCNGSINHCTMDLPQMISLFTTEIIDPARIGGTLLGKGSFTLSLQEESWRAECLLNADLKKCRLDHFSLSDMDHVSFYFDSNKGVSLRNLLFTVDEQYPLHLEKLAADFTYGELILDRLQFGLSKQQALLFYRMFNPYFSGQQFEEIFDSLQFPDTINGYLSLEYAPPYGAFTLFLEEGKWDEWPFTDMRLEVDPFEVNASLQTELFDTPAHLHIHSKDPLLLSGSLLIQTDEELKLIWNRNNGFVIDSLQGSYPGIILNLKRNEQNLSGTASIQTDALPMSFKSRFSNWQVGGCFSWEGSFSQKAKSFEGMLTGNPCCFLGYRFENFSSYVSANPNRIRLSSLALNDEAVTAIIDEATITPHPTEGTILSSSPIFIENLIPSLLQTEGVDRPLKKRALKIKKLEIANFLGKLEDPRSFRGTGNLKFSNMYRKNQANFLFAVPAEILSRLGLDTAALTPVTGSISFDIRDGKMLFTKFKDVYSEGKLSKFYLPETPYEPFLDWEGNLHLQLKMKQFNLLLKFTELFTVTVSGTLDKPQFSMQQIKSGK